MRRLQYLLLPDRNNIIQILVVISIAVLQHVVCKIEFFSGCEKRDANVHCGDDKLIHILDDSVQYGLLAENMCASDDMASSNTTLCEADRVYSNNVVVERCHLNASCLFRITDGLFRLGESPSPPCPNRTVIRSNLIFRYECRNERGSLGSNVEIARDAPRHQDQVTPASSDENDAITKFITFPTRRPLPVLILPCENGTTKIEDCYEMVCSDRIWKNTTKISPDPSCCALQQRGCGSPPSPPYGLVNSTSDYGAQSTQSTYSADNARAAPGVGSGTTPIIGGCAAENTTEPENISWRVARASTWQSATCPGDYREAPAFARRYCRADGTWDKSIDTKNCVSSKVLNVLPQNIKSEEAVEKFTANIVAVAQNQSLGRADILAVSHVLRGIGTYISTVSNTNHTVVFNATQNAFKAGDQVLNNMQTWNKLEEHNRSPTTMKVVAALEHVARKTAAKVSADLNVQTGSIELNVKVVKLNSVRENPVISVSGKGGTIQFPAKNLVSTGQDSGYGRLVTVFYKNNDLWSDQGEQKVNSPVFSASVVESGSPARRQLRSPFVYTLKQHWHSARASNCVYWEDAEPVGKWSTDGCWEVKAAKGYSRCKCNHLTNFAVLMDVSGTTLAPAHELALGIITYAGCVISIVSLLMAWLTFLLLRNLSSDRNTIHKHLVFTLMLAEVLFLLAISPHIVQLKTFCAVLAGVLHFLFLSVFAWTCLEGVQLYIMLIEVFEAERSRTLYYYLAGYGIPAIVVGISAAVNSGGYGRDTVCWLKTDDGFIWSFVAPVAAVMAVNVVMLGVAIYMMYNHAKMVASMKHKETTRTDNIRAWIKGAAVLVVLLGLTWVFGFMYVSEDSKVMAYIFTITNSLQGLFIFIFHCIGNEKIQKEYKKYVRRTQWLPNCIRVKYGEHKGLSSVPSHSSASSGYLSRYFSRRRKSTDTVGGSRKQMGGIFPVNSNGNIVDDESLIAQSKLSSTSGQRKDSMEDVIMIAHGGEQVNTGLVPNGEEQVPAWC